MKKQLAASLIAVSLLTLSSIASAADSGSQEPMLLTAAQMDGVTAGRQAAAGRNDNPGYWRPVTSVFNQAAITQINMSPVTIIQIGNNNYAVVFSGNFASISQ